MLSSLTLSVTLCLFALVSARPVIPRATDFTGGTGQGTYYDTGLTSCGKTYTDSDLIVALSHFFYDTYPGATANPNNNPVCGKKLTAHYQGKSVTVTVADRCTGCAMYDLDFTPTGFEALSDLSVGRISGVTWTFDDSASEPAVSGNGTTPDPDSDSSSGTSTNSTSTTGNPDSSSGDTADSTDLDSSSAVNITTQPGTTVNTTTTSSDIGSAPPSTKRRIWARETSLVF
ncbi:RlpA-like double-psi beta-barrel-protein domain-containing protein-containing protein [Lentinula edodes]|uniref:RlpA-like double-psi beta-barrel-protein domain-containing protein-containing protein n=1 Tax=Lentinula edodes TaxID=5353 RepID=UPI001E8ED2F6|nr:RlpA-like double-psi beta-barrel-protein domain-containing protein-containing protein [Lentinula edodes]KAH7869946.1 RlpA-like double-psi beta-barrel-protein domain-containing protein-containing protein [Lentinula edodes]KAJ3914229.1 putative riboflavin aldehyde-forming enzyme [Lentinula edodes]